MFFQPPPASCEISLFTETQPLNSLKWNWNSLMWQPGVRRMMDTNDVVHVVERAGYRQHRNVAPRWILKMVISCIIRTTPGHALHEKGLRRQIQIGVGTLVNSIERRAAVVPQIRKPRINRSSTAAFSPRTIYIRFRLLELQKKHSRL